MKKPWIACVLNLLLPGSGLAYLGKWWWAALNFILVQLVLLAIVLWQPNSTLMEHFHYVMIGLAGASAGAAHAVALRMNAQDAGELVA